MKQLHDVSAESVDRCLLVQVVAGREGRAHADDSLNELRRLADTAGMRVVGAITQHRDYPSAGFCVGTGKVEDIRAACAHANANLVVFDNELTPLQAANLHAALGVQVQDRTELILQIFARRARSAEARHQVELAQLRYVLSRVAVRAEQQRFHGAIGMRGPGESPLALRNAPMRRRIRQLEEQIEALRKRTEVKRNRQRWPVVALVGYTNVGKSTLLNSMAGADAYVDDRLFATLDTLTRRMRLPNGQDVLLTDTVGFIRNLPHGLVASFRSTLDEAVNADLLLVVLDAAHEFARSHMAVARSTLKEIGAGDVPRLTVLNKIDSPKAVESMPELLELFPDAVCVSALSGQGLDTLRSKIAWTFDSMKSGCAS